MKLSKTTTILLIVLAVVVIIGAIVIYNATGNVPTDEEIISESSGSSTSPDEVLFISLASQIESITFDEEFLNDPKFLSLVDIGELVVPEPTGRKDPFANLSGIVPAR